MIEQMTSRERLMSALEGKPVDRIPYSPLTAYVWETFPKEVQDRGADAFHREVGGDLLWRAAPCPVTAKVEGAEVKNYWDNGMTVTETITPVGTIRVGYAGSGIGRTFFVHEHPLKTIEDYKVQLWIEQHTEYTMADQTGIKNLTSRTDGLALGMALPRGKTAFQTLIETYAGTEELTFALFEHPNIVEELWQTMVENDLKAIRMSARSDYEYFLTWEDSSTQNYSPAMFEKYIASEIKQWCDIFRAAGNKKYVQHACGHTRHIIKMMKESGVAAIESLSARPTGDLEIKEARELMGPEVGLIGGIEPIHFLDLPIEELEIYVAQIIEEASGGPFIMANSDSCPPGVTVEKFKLVGEVVRRCPAQ